MKTLTKVIGSCIGMAAAIALSPSMQAQNLLVDPGFELGAAGQPNPIPIPGGAGGGWGVFGGVTYSTAQPETGTYSLQGNQGAGAAWNFIGGYQAIGGATASQQYLLSGDYMTTTGLGAYAGAYIQITFLSAAGADIGTVETGGVGAKAANFLPAAANTWYSGNVTATAPAGAAYVAPYVAFMMNGSQAAPVDLYWDNVSLSGVPEPSSLALLGMGLAIPFYFLRRRK